MILNLLLMLAWCAFTSDFQPQNLAIGFGIGLGSLAVLSRLGLTGDSRYVPKIGKVVGFVGFYLWELLIANVRMARDVLSPRLQVRPAIIALPLDMHTDSDSEIALLANLISLTPGTLTIDISNDRRTLYIHAVNVPGGDVEAFCLNLKQQMERRVLEVLE